MALVAELGVQLGAGRPGRERVAARAANRRDVVVGMDVSLHHELQSKVGGLSVCLETRVNSNVSRTSEPDRPQAPDGALAISARNWSLVLNDPRRSVSI